jgi:hypothetical protein
MTFGKPGMKVSGGEDESGEVEDESCEVEVQKWYKTGALPPQPPSAHPKNEQK